MPKLSELYNIDILRCARMHVCSVLTKIFQEQQKKNVIRFNFELWRETQRYSDVCWWREMVPTSGAELIRVWFEFLLDGRR